MHTYIHEAFFMMVAYYYIYIYVRTYTYCRIWLVHRPRPPAKTQRGSLSLSLYIVISCAREAKAVEEKFPQVVNYNNLHTAVAASGDG